MDVREEIVDAATDDGEMAVAVAQPVESPTTGGIWPTAVVFIDAPGLRPATHEFMVRLAGHGYRVITPDLHHRNGRLLHFEPKDMVEDPSRREIVWQWIASMTDDQIQHDFDCALTACGVDDDEKIGVIGFCLGARAVYRSMMRLPDRVACGAGWHPSFLADDRPDSPHLTAARLAHPLYLGIGEDDEVQSIAMHQPFLDAVAGLDHVEVVTFPGADHGYTWPGYPSYDEAAAETSWTRTLAMFDDTLR
jgi:carboxymethylenebutenolidase